MGRFRTFTVILGTILAMEGGKWYFNPAHTLEGGKTAIVKQATAKVASVAATKVVNTAHSVGQMYHNTSGWKAVGLYSLTTLGGISQVVLSIFFICMLAEASKNNRKVSITSELYRDAKNDGFRVGDLIPLTLGLPPMLAIGTTVGVARAVRKILAFQLIPKPGQTGSGSQSMRA